MIDERNVESMDLVCPRRCPARQTSAGIEGDNDKVYMQISVLTQEPWQRICASSFGVCLSRENFIIT